MKKLFIERFSTDYDYRAYEKICKFSEENQKKYKTFEIVSFTNNQHRGSPEITIAYYIEQLEIDFVELQEKYKDLKENILFRRQFLESLYKEKRRITKKDIAKAIDLFKGLAMTDEEINEWNKQHGMGTI